MYDCNELFDDMDVKHQAPVANGEVNIYWENNTVES